MAIGTCNLTRKTGKYVRSHLIPKALTKPEEPGLPFLQAGYGQFIKRHSSWYDSNLVTAEGEAILSALDGYAIDTLRKSRLVWSGWGPMQALGATQALIPGTAMGFRTVIVNDPGRLRLFFLSLLWRAAASSLPEFAEVELPADDLEQLRQMLINGSPSPLSFYPTSLTQLSTLGLIHNQTPFRDAKFIPPIGPEAGRHIPIIRFYFDGLVSHIHSHADDNGYTEAIGSLVVGAGEELIVTTVPYEDSLEHSNLLTVMTESVLSR